MGTQQILLIVLSVIIVGVAVAVGIQMFNTQAMNSNRQAVVGDLQTLGAQVMQYHRTPTSQGGGGNNTTTAYDAATIGDFIGWNGTVDTTDTGDFSIATAIGTVTIVGHGTEKGNDGTNNVGATLVVTLSSGSPLATSIDN
jgi:hypothetical protein